MFSRKLIDQGKPLTILMDTESFGPEQVKSRHFKGILLHRTADDFELIRTPDTPSAEILSLTPDYEHVPAYSLTNGQILINVSPVRFSCIAFSYQQTDIQNIALELLKKTNPTDSEQENAIRQVTKAFVQAALNWNQKGIFITENLFLLENAFWLETHFPGQALNVMKLEEASILLDLHHKNRDEFFLIPKHKTNGGRISAYTTSKSVWYSYSFLEKIALWLPNDKWFNAMYYKFQWLLMALDEIGICFYSGVKKDPSETLQYHFNYLIALAAGILDNLALMANDDFVINFSPNSRISLSSDSGRVFLKKIKEKMPELRKHIEKYSHFISLVYMFRQPILHREGFQPTHFDAVGSWDTEGRGKVICFKIDDQIRNQLKMCGDNEESRVPFSNWGVVSQSFPETLVVGIFDITGEQLKGPYTEPAQTIHSLEPFCFARRLASTLIEFVNGYLLILKANSSTSSSVFGSDEGYKLFKEFHLGFSPYGGAHGP